MATHTQSGTGHCRFPRRQTDAHDGPKDISTLTTYLIGCIIGLPCSHLNLMERKCFNLFKSTVQVELPPIEMVSIEGEVIIFPTVTGVGQNIASTFGETKKDVPETTKVTENTSLHHARLSLNNVTYPNIRYKCYKFTTQW